MVGLPSPASLLARLSGRAALLCLLLAAPAAVAPRRAPAIEALEPNDTLAAAAPLGAGAWPGRIHAGDLDYFRVELAPDEALDVHLAFAHAAGDLDLKILAPEGHALASSISTTDDEAAYWYPRSDAPATLVIQVYGYLGAANDYTLTVARLAAGGLPAGDDALEEDDDAGTATPLGRTARLADLVGADEDWFLLDVAPHDTLRAALRFRDAMGDLDLDLLDAAGEVVAASHSATDDEEIVAEFLPSGIYHLRVFSEEPGARNAYALELDLDAPAGAAQWEVARPALFAPPGTSRDAGRTIAGAGGTTGLPAPPRRTFDLAGDPAREGAARLVPGEFLVRWRDPEAARAFAAAIAARPQDAPWSARPLLAHRARPATSADSAPSPLAAWTVVRAAASGPAGRPRALDEQLKELRALPGVAHVEPNRLWPVAGDLATAAGRAPSDLALLLDLPALHARSRGEGVVIAVIDTGLRADLPPFAGALWRHDVEAEGLPGVDDDGNGLVDDVAGYDFVSVDPALAHPDEDAAPPDADVTDRHGHGTAVAGVAVARTPPGAATPGGVAPAASLMPLRAGFSLPGGQGVLATSDWIAAVAYAADHGADILNLSFAGTDASPAAAEACAWAAGRGCLVVAAAGNQSFYLPRYPAAFDGVVAVGSVGATGTRSSFSNFGAWVDLLGFGEEVEVVGLDGAPRRASGTSFAAPAVAGLAAALLADGGGSAPELLGRLRLAARDPYLANPAYAGQLGAGWPHGAALAAQRAEEERGELARLLLRNVGLTPALLAPRAEPPWSVEPLRTDAERRVAAEAALAGGPPDEGVVALLPGDARLVAVRAADGRPLHDLLAAGAPAGVVLAPGDPATPPAVGLLALAPVPPAPPLDLLAPEAAWAAVPFTPTPAFPWQAGSFRRDGDALCLALPGAGDALAMAQAVARPAPSAGGLQLATFDPLTWPEDPAIDARFRLHAGDWNEKGATWIYGRDEAGRRLRRPARVELVVEVEPAHALTGWRAAVDLLRLGEPAARGAAPPRRGSEPELRVGGASLGATVPLPREPSWRIDALAVPDLAGGWSAITPRLGDMPPGVVAPADEPGGGVAVRVDHHDGAGAFVESSPLRLEPGRLHRLRFRVAAGEALPAAERAPLMLYAWRCDDRSQAWSRLVESAPGRTGPAVSPAPRWVSLFVRLPSEGGAAEVRVGAGLWNRDPADRDAQSVRIDFFEAASVEDPWMER